MEARRPSQSGHDRNRALPLLIPVIAFGGLVLCGLAWFLICPFTIQPHEVGLVQRFGETIRTAEPGLNFKLPSPIEEVLKVPIHHLFKQEFGFRTSETKGSDLETDRDVEAESLMIAGDLNIVAVQWTTHYRIGDPRKYLF